MESNRSPSVYASITNALPLGQTGSQRNQTEVLPLTPALPLGQSGLQRNRTEVLMLIPALPLGQSGLQRNRTAVLMLIAALLAPYRPSGIEPRSYCLYHQPYRFTARPNRLTAESNRGPTAYTTSLTALPLGQIGSQRNRTEVLTTTLTIYFIHPSRKIKLSFEH